MLTGLLRQSSCSLVRLVVKMGFKMVRMFRMVVRLVVRMVKIV